VEYRLKAVRMEGRLQSSKTKNKTAETISMYDREKEERMYRRKLRKISQRTKEIGWYQKHCWKMTLYKGEKCPRQTGMINREKGMNLSLSLDCKGS
jgi:hypothetical protein